MPIKKDGTGKRWVEMNIVVPGTPERVWQALATGEGNAGWFVKGEIEPKVGGMFRLDFGQGVVTSGQVTQWEPPHQFGYVERDWEPGAPPVTTEITIVGRAGERSVVRMVHSLFTSTDDWDDQIEGFENSWPGFFAILRLYLQHFSGQPAASFISSEPSKLEALEAWQRLAETLGLAGANVGERRSLSAEPEAVSGVVEQVHQDDQQRYVLLRLDAPSSGLVLIGTSAKKSGGARVSVCRYAYGAQATQQIVLSEQRWREWLSKSFA
jgi:uncharacterized protein YndB with AHSA1/START domain